ncbi:uncharacterized protein LOC116011789 [Ipomoea triloba]|uniref:uncharacterized protein LOC116011789 n=1 Tax=Ipomoea triloba TaxID=35885 RepID=UPI00125D4D36|nr:uncharacterized protein LOC116011789 [Ipomoea triloba]
MRTLCPNLDRMDGLETVLEVPIPNEVYSSPKDVKAWVKSHREPSISGGRNAEIQLLLGVIGAPLIPHPVRPHHFPNNKINDHPIETAMAKYIVLQYMAAAGGESALGCIENMYAMGKVKVASAEFVCEDNGLNNGGKKVMKKMKSNGAQGEMGGFVVWQKRPDLWSLELLISGCKISAGSDGKVAWRQTPWHNSHAARGPPRPLRRTLQGLDPMSTANLFSNSICSGERTVNGEECFVLKLEAEPTALKARSSSNVEIMRHTVWGYFSQRTGLLIQLQDSHLLRIKSPGNDDVLWETTMTSLIQDYRTLKGVNIAHAGRTSVSLSRLDQNSQPHTVTRMEEVWSIEEVDFNVKGLSADSFLPPSDLFNKKQGDRKLSAFLSSRKT